VTRDPRLATNSIVPFRPELASAFAELNRAWIESLFVLEEADWKVLRNPEESIMQPGGQIFFAMDGAQAVGTAAAIRVAPETFELGKMAVRPSHQGQGLGERLGRAVIDYARSEGAAKVYLETNSRLANAIRLYQRLGFRPADFPVPSDYERADVYMELRLRAEG
jgi:GNAT superfamily N-acetyltransferase